MRNYLDCTAQIINPKEPLPSWKETLKVVFDMAWPSVLESVLIALIGAVDMIMVGSLGATAISAVGITTQPKMLIMAPIMALNIGVTVLVSRRKGAGLQEQANLYLRNCLLISFGISLVLCTLGFIYAEPFLRFAGANNEYLVDAVQYFRIIMVGNFFYCVSLTITAAQRGAGNTKISMVTNLTANLVNVVFNFFLIYGILIFPKWGVVGAAVATMMGNCAACIIAFISILNKKRFLYISLKQNWGFTQETLSSIWNIANSSLVEQIFLRIGFFLFVKVVAGLGTVPFAAHQICMNMMTISFAFGDGLSIANTTLVGQSLGRKRPDMAMLYAKVTQRLGMLLAVLVATLMAIFRLDLLHLFSNDMEVIAAGSIPMLMLSVIILFQVPQVITVGCLRGAGDVKFVAKLMLVSVSIIRPGLSWLFCTGLGFGLIGAWVGVFLDQLTRNVVSSHRFKQGDWTEIQV